MRACRSWPFEPYLWSIVDVLGVRGRSTAGMSGTERMLLRSDIERLSDCVPLLPGGAGTGDWAYDLEDGGVIRLAD